MEGVCEMARGKVEQLKGDIGIVILMSQQLLLKALPAAIQTCFNYHFRLYS